MTTLHVDNPDNLPDGEISAYVRRAEDMIASGQLDNGVTRLVISIAENRDFVNVVYLREQKPFERIRRITGYLTGSLEAWNDAKRAEERDRVRHGVLVATDCGDIHPEEEITKHLDEEY